MWLSVVMSTPEGMHAAHLDLCQASCDLVSWFRVTHWQHWLSVQPQVAAIYAKCIHRLCRRS